MSGLREPFAVGAGAVAQLDDTLALLEQARRRLVAASAIPGPRSDRARAEQPVIAERVAAIVEAAISIQAAAGEIATGLSQARKTQAWDVAATHELLLADALDAKAPDRSAAYEGARRALLRLWADEMAAVGTLRVLEARPAVRPTLGLGGAAVRTSGLLQGLVAALVSGARRLPAAVDASSRSFTAVLRAP